MSKSCIILSQGPVPSPEHTKVEGGGLRCWGLAKGIHANNPDIQVTVAYHESYVQDNFTDKFEGINIATWNVGNLPELIGRFDSVVVSYCMSDLSVITADTIRPDQQLILDCYVPIYVEVSARETDNLDGEYHAFHHDVGRWAHVLRRGDVFLCASEPQKKFYKGVLSGIGRINPATYGDDFIKIVPYGIYREAPQAQARPITQLLGEKRAHAKKILWFGGIYPWFDLRVLIDAVKVLNKTVPATLVIVGAKNPFNDHPDFTRRYDELIQHIEHSEAEGLVVMQDWVKFEERADWYLDSDLVVVINKEGEENSLSWRTRLVDFMWANLPVITNGGDPLGEKLITNGAATRLSDLSAEGLSRDLGTALHDNDRLKQIKSNLGKLKAEFYWDTVTLSLSEAIASHHKARDLERYGNITVDGGALPPASKLVKIRKVASKAKMIPVYARKHGVQNTYYAIRTKVNRRLGARLGTQRTKPGVVMVAHQLDFSGAPYVFMDLAQAVTDAAGGTPVEFHTFNPSFKENFSRLNKMGLKPNLHISRDADIPFLNGDTVVLNTAAHSTGLKHSIYNSLDTGRLNKLVWFIHEDEPELNFEASEAKIVRKLMAKGRIVMFIAAKKTLLNYQEFFESKAGVRFQPYKYVIPEEYRLVRGPADFNKISFILPGTMGDGRKGQLPVFYAMGNFLDQYYRAKPDDYRDFELVYVGVTKDFLSRQVLKHADKLLGKRFRHHGIVSHERSSELMMASNVTICYSLRECLPLFVFEGMAAGHPLLRNDSSGIDEQLFDGKNGWLLDSTDFRSVTASFEQLLNRSKTTNDQLAAMSKYSNMVALDQANHSYDPMVKEIFS